ncbi:hypothetical protein GCM10009664_02290 [Kitasatospora gansuensis]
MTVARTASTGTTLVQYPVRTRSGSRPVRAASGRETALGTVTTYRAGPWANARVRPFDVTIGQKCGAVGRWQRRIISGHGS